MRYHVMKELAKRHPNREICGFTIRANGVDTVLPVPNVHYNSDHNFAMHAELQNLYMNSIIASDDCEITGMYHSHNNGKTGPSKGDLAAWPNFPEAADWEYFIIVDGDEIWSWKIVDGDPVGTRVD